MAADGFIISFTKPDLGCARPKAFLHLHSISATAHGTLTYSGLVALSSYHLDLTFKLIISTIEGVWLDFIFNSAQAHLKLAREAQQIDLDNNFSSFHRLARNSRSRQTSVTTSFLHQGGS